VAAHDAASTSTSGTIATAPKYHTQYTRTP
jgi:hypothetical protein